MAAGVRAPAGQGGIAGAGMSGMLQGTYECEELPNWKSHLSKLKECTSRLQPAVSPPPAPAEKKLERAALAGLWSYRWEWATLAAAGESESCPRGGRRTWKETGLEEAQSSGATRKLT